MPSYWFLKSESAAYSWDDLMCDGKTSWTGVRNFQARNNLRAMKKGDFGLLYHSGDERAVMGSVEVVQDAYSDPTADEGAWMTVDIIPKKGFCSSCNVGAYEEYPWRTGCNVFETITIIGFSADRKRIWQYLCLRRYFFFTIKPPYRGFYFF